MGWFKDFFFGDIEENEFSHSKERTLPRANSQSRNEKLKRQSRPQFNMENKERINLIWKKTTRKSLDTKMVYQYPNKEFRFPVISDRALKKESTGDSIIKESFPKKGDLHPSGKEQKSTKKVFVPTEVPSPIFAFQKRPTTFEFDLDQYSSQRISKKNSPLVPKKVETKDTQDENLPKDVFRKETPLSRNPIDTNSSEAIKNSEKKELSPVFKDKPKGNSIKTQKADPSFEKKQPAAENTEKILHKGRIPFNVMMVNQDKRALSQKGGLAKGQLEATEDKKIQAEKGNIKNAVKLEMPFDQSIDTEGYNYPPLRLIRPPVPFSKNSAWIYQQKAILNETFKNFNVKAHVVGHTEGPAVTRFEVQLEKGVKVNKITNLTDDIKLSLAAKDIRIEAPIPGKNTVGIEIPNQTSHPVMLSELLKTEAFVNNPSPLTAALGLDISGTPVITDLQKMPHGLIAGATGSGKSVCINSLLISLLYKASPDSLKLLLIDPKIVELAPYNRIPHLLSPVITDAKAATAALKWAVEEMERRYQLFFQIGTRSLEKYNEKAEEASFSHEKLPYILIIIDELADLMMIAPSDVEESISRIAQKARACGIHLIVATQRPSVDVITGLIKANIPTRISFSVSSAIDSRTIIDSTGAEKLLGKGDMLFLPSGTSKPIRVQGTFVSDEEIEAVVEHVRRQAEPHYLFEEKNLLEKVTISEEEDELFDQVCEFVVEQNAASTSLLQRQFRIGYNRAARLMEMLENGQIVSKNKGSKPRDIIITREQLEKRRQEEGKCDFLKS